MKVSRSSSLQIPNSRSPFFSQLPNQTPSKMEKRKVDPDHNTPLPNPSPFLRDVSNYKTPKPYFKNPNPNPNPSPIPLFFTASKKTPSSSSSSASQSAFGRRPSAVPSSHSKAARRLKTLELEQSRSSRKAQIRREKALKSFSRSVSAWLNFLFKNPTSCGCNLESWSADRVDDLCVNGKRRSLDGGGRMGMGRVWRNPKRQRNSCQWGPLDGDGVEQVSSMPASAMFSSLQVSLQNVCSFEDLKERMVAYMSRKSCHEVLSMMSQVAKNIDEGRLKMKAHCPMVTDLGLKETATRVLMCYNPTWLRIGLHIVFGGDSLLNEEEKSDQEELLLKMFIEKQFFSHSGLAKSYAYNKLVEGLYRPGYFEALGSIILKRFLLLVISLDKAKCESTIPIKYGIDGIDGGSPLLFRRSSHIKSSRQVIHEFLSEVMRGEGDLLAHLVIVGCKVNHHQFPLVDYDFSVVNLFEDLQDGILFCRAVQLLLCDASILSKVVAPSDTRKKNLQNCAVAMHYLKQARVPLSDGDGVQIVSEDVSNGDKELTLSILWNMFVHLQIPLLIDKTLLVDELIKVKGSTMDHSNLLKCNTMNHMALLLEWTQAVCGWYCIKVESFSSLIDGKVLRCLIDYYFRNELHSCLSSNKETQETYNDELIRLFDTDNTVSVHNFVLAQSVTAMFGNFPEVLQISDIMDEDAAYDERSVMILLVFLASLLIHRKNMGQLTTCSITRSSYRTPDLKTSVVSRLPHSGAGLLINCDSPGKSILRFESPLKKDGLDKYQTEDALKKVKFIQNWWHALAERNHYLKMKLAASLLQAAVRCQLGRKRIVEMRRERAARVIQSHFRGSIYRNNYLMIKMATSLLQAAIRAWLEVRMKSKSNTVGLGCSVLRQSSGIYGRYLKLMIERHRFLRIKKSVLLIQQAVRSWITQRRHRENTTSSETIAFADMVSATIAMQSYIRGQMARTRYTYVLAQLKKREVLEHQNRAAFEIQFAWKRFTVHNLHMQWSSSAIIIQSSWRAWLMRKKFLCQIGAIIEIQAGIRCLNYQKSFIQYRRAAIEIQRFARGQLIGNRLLGASDYRSLRSDCGSHYTIDSNFLKHMELKLFMHSILKLQRWWRQILLCKSRAMSAIIIQSLIRGWSARRMASKQRHSISTIQRWWRNILFLESRKRAALIIQAHIRGWIERRAANRDRNRVVVIQSYWKGYLIRRSSKQQVSDLRCKLEKSAAKVDNDMRLINRLIAALSDLLSHRSISNIRHTCATLNVATEHSQKCCETLVAAGALDILLKQFHSLNRGVPDQEVLKHMLYTLRNIVRYPHLAEALVNTHQSVEIIFQELLRNKNEGCFVACELLKKLCATQEGLEAIRKLQGHTRRLHSLVQNLERKTQLQKRSTHLAAGRDFTVRRLREATNILKLIMDDHQ